ncbi:helix-turn-helix domain-containing protein [Corynebacterium glutamicum]|uniref:helix-turn-helix domain-containing protein n=1 Tax=Corynebacterium glutamicum TaxID=1718 RepID=UPI00146916CC|nr:helix-turn-helix domain-containing protein [Corynebacterium glutamicum]GFK19305.1 hypothetical protein KbCgl_18770 [Corynebacterium glutamicum]
MSESKTYSVPEASEILGIRESTLYQWLRDERPEVKDLQAFFIGTWRVPRRTVDAKANGLAA